MNLDELRWFQMILALQLLFSLLSGSSCFLPGGAGCRDLPSFETAAPGWVTLDRLLPHGTRAQDVLPRPELGRIRSKLLWILRYTPIKGTMLYHVVYVQSIKSAYAHDTLVIHHWFILIHYHINNILKQHINNIWLTVINQYIHPYIHHTSRPQCTGHLGWSSSRGTDRVATAPWAATWRFYLGRPSGSPESHVNKNVVHRELIYQFTSINELMENWWRIEYNWCISLVSKTVSNSSKVLKCVFVSFNLRILILEDHPQFAGCSVQVEITRSETSWETLFERWETSHWAIGIHYSLFGYDMGFDCGP